jgi:uncharacterized protein (DUF1778 family)
MKREAVTVRMPKLTYDLLKQAAEEDGRSMNEYCVRAIKAAAVRTMEKKKKGESPS